MKKVLFIFFLIILYIIIITEKSESAFVEKIDLNLKENEMGVTFIPLDSSKSLLINKDGTRILIILEYKNSHKINEVLELFGVDNLDYILMNKNYDIDLRASYIEVTANKELEINEMDFLSNKNIFKIEYLDHNFCVYEEVKTYKSNEICQYIYFLNIDENLKINDTVDMVFYNEDTDSTFLEPIYDKWIDVYMIKKDYYVTLKLDEDTYDTITLPLDK